MSITTQFNPIRNKIGVVVRCVICRQEFSLTVSGDAYQAWISGTLIQDAMPELTPGQRELLISKTCEKCFDKLTKEIE